MITTLGAVSTKPAPPRALGPSRNQSNDWDLIQRCKQGDQDAWNSLIAHHEKSVYKFAYSLSRNYDDAADIAGQVFVRLYENIHTFRNESHFTSWLFCIVRNVYVDTCIRAPHRSHLSLDDGMEFEGERLVREIVDPSPSPEECSIETERQELLSNAISHLPEYQRRMMVMYHGENRSYEEIATVTGLSLGTVKSRLSRARHMLRERLAGMQDVLAPV